MSGGGGFVVRDLRNKHFFLVDDVYLNGYAKVLGATASLIYFCLCRHADKEQIAFPSQRYLAEKLNLNERTVMEKIALLERWHIIKKKRVRSTWGRWLNNAYVLLDKSEWRVPSPSARNLQVEPHAGNLQEPPAVKVEYKDTHIEGYKYNNLVERITHWAYERASSSPSCRPDSFGRSVVRAIDRVGAEKVDRLFAVSDNAIQFLVDIKSA